MSDIRAYIYAAVIAMALSSSYLLDGPDDTQAAQDVADQVQALENIR